MRLFNPYITGSIELDISGSIETNVPWPTSSYSETFNDAPSDGKTYGRKDGTWVEYAGTTPFNLIYSAQILLASFSRTNVLSIVTVP